MYLDQKLTASLPALFALTSANSYAILNLGGGGSSSSATLAAQLGTIDHGPANVLFSSTVTFTYDYNISTDHTMTFGASAAYNGNGHAINLPSISSPALIFSNGVTATLANMQLKGFRGAHISLGTGSFVYFGNGTEVDLSSAQTLVMTVTFAGNTILNGNDTTLTLGSGGQLVVARGSTLTLRNITISGVGGNNIVCLDNTAALAFDNVKLCLSSNYNFSSGAFSVNRSLDITGNSTFAYSTSKTSTILAASELLIDRNMTFSYDAPSTNKNLLEFYNPTAILHCNTSTLHTTQTGIQLTNGTLMIEGQVTLENEATTMAGAIVFGNGNADSDLRIIMRSGCSLIGSERCLMDYQNSQG